MRDLINRQAAIDELRTCQTYLFDTHDKDLKISLEDAEYCIERLPSAQPERKKGRWIAHEGGKFVGFPYMHYECDQCRAFEPTETNFCPNCGADMRGEQDG